MEFNSIPPFFSTILTLYTLILLYAPSFFLTILLSPVLNSTGIILLFLLKLGANETPEKESDCPESRVLDHKDKHHEQLPSLEQRFLDLVDRNQTHPQSHHPEFDHDLGPGSESNSQDDYTRMEMESKQVDTTMKFVKWDLKAPLQIIYEAYEGEEEEDGDEYSENNIVYGDKNVSELEKYPSLSMYYPESETDSSSDDDFPMNGNWESVFLNWEKEDDEREELLEISVDIYEKRSIEFCRVEEDNLIEIDIFSKRS